MNTPSAAAPDHAHVAHAAPVNRNQELKDAFLQTDVGQKIKKMLTVAEAALKLPSLEAAHTTAMGKTAEETRKGIGATLMSRFQKTDDSTIAKAFEKIVTELSSAMGSLTPSEVRIATEMMCSGGFVNLQRVATHLAPQPFKEVLRKLDA